MITGWRRMKIELFAALVMLCCCSGCWHRTNTVRPESTAQSPLPVRPVAPKITVITNNQGPIKYQWGFTNTAEGTKVLKFAPQQ